MVKGSHEENPLLNAGEKRSEEVKAEMERQRGTAMKVTILCALWFTFSAITNNVGKAVYQHFPFPITLTMVQVISVWLYMEICVNVFGVSEYQKIPNREQLYRYILPLSFGKVTSSVFAQISIMLVPVSYAHTVKAMAPIFAVIFARVVLGEMQTTGVYLSLLPIIGGVLIATVSEIEFNIVGMLAALFSIIIIALQNVYSKKAMKDKAFDHHNLLMHTSYYASLMLLPYWLLTEGKQMYYLDGPLLTDTEVSMSWVVMMLMINGFCNFGQSMMAFSVLSVVSPVTYAVCNTTKRVVVITSAMIIFQNVSSWINVLGMATAIFGIFLYNREKIKQRVTSKREKEVLPWNSLNARTNGVSLRKTEDGNPMGIMDSMKSFLNPRQGSSHVAQD
eukprot:Clim_evm40s156 gene=Clim_evmTU40s156